MPDFSDSLRSFFTDENRPLAAQAVADYFAQSGGRFTGSQFEKMVDGTHPHEITERDLVAVTTLSVSIPARPALWILSDAGRQAIGPVLEQVSTYADIWNEEAEELLAPSGPLWRLWDLLGQAHWPEPRLGGGLGGLTKRSKLLAAKRPGLVPILDKRVRRLLPKSEDYWADFRAAFCDESLRADVEAATTGAPDGVSLLRRADVVLWMAAQRSS